MSQDRPDPPPDRSSSHKERNDGAREIQAAVDTLAAHIPGRLRPLARIAYNYWWSWDPAGPPLFQSVDPHRWALSGQNPVRLLQEVSPSQLEALAGDAAFLSRMEALEHAFDRYLSREEVPGPLPPGGAIAFMCAEFGVHQTLPIYAGGLGVLAGDLLKEASDRGLPMAGVGLLYSQGSFHQRLDVSGWQHEYWLETDAERLPAVRVGLPDRAPLTVSVAIRNREVFAHVWRVDVGRVPLFLLDTNIGRNSVTDRWIGARLYTGDMEMRLAQYALLGIGGVRALRAMGIEPSILHLNEGHAALACLEIIGEQMAAGRTFDEALKATRSRVMFTTHTPVAAGNDTFSPDEMQTVLDDIHVPFGLQWDEFLRLGRRRPEDQYERFGMTPFALRLSGESNGVSRRHGDTSRRMWHELWPGEAVDDVPIGYVTNGVHLPTWMAPGMRSLLERHLGAGWEDRAADPAIWAGIERIPDEELWALRGHLRAELVHFVRGRSVRDRLGRGQPTAFAEAAADIWDDKTLTIGFARRIATYKRLYLISALPERGLRLIREPNPIQLVIAGKAHPNDEEAKRTVQRLFAFDDLPGVAGRVVFLEEHDLAMAARLVRGCDLWINLPRPPLEASGTSGMKSALNGGLQLSVLDGWWAEAYDGHNGWAIQVSESIDAATQDTRDANALFDLLEYTVLPLFYERDGAGIPRGWMSMVKASMASIGPRFNTIRTLNEYIARASGLGTANKGETEG
jgi:starch phosphorylase